MKAVLHSVALDAFADDLSMMIHEQGSDLTGGQRQRIGIVRAFLHGGAFILLDEPTSNLDALNEGMIMKTLKESAQGRTIVLVSHPNSTLSIADQIYDLVPEQARKKEASASVFLSVSSCYAYGHSYGPLQT